MKHLFNWSVVKVVFFSVLTCLSAEILAADAELTKSDKVVALLKSIETRDPKPVTYINPNKYIQHNLAVADGLAGLGNLLKNIPSDAIKVNTVRVFEDGDFVVAHSEYEFFGPKIGFDVFRFEDGLIVEHWDNLQVKPDSLNPSGRSMIDGEVVVSNAHHTHDNKRIVKNFIQEVLITGQFDQLPRYIDGENYLQHNPSIADGLSGLSSGFEALTKQGVIIRYHKMHHIFGSGNFVLAISEGDISGKSTAFYDLFRVDGGKLVEHWDTIESIPNRNDWKNSNGKF